MKKSCQHCGGIHEESFVCEHGRRHYLPKDKRREDKFRNSTAWRKKREQIRTRDFNLCRVCLEEQTLCFNGIEVHHITPLAEDYTRRLNDGNLICLCIKHHKAADRGKLDRKRLFELSRCTPRGIGKMGGGTCATPQQPVYTQIFPEMTGGGENGETCESGKYDGEASDGG